jgi:hypothetical protein
MPADTAEIDATAEKINRNPETGALALTVAEIGS